MSDPWRRAAVLSAAAAGLLHLVATSGHGGHGVEIVGFILAAGTAQVALALVLVRSVSAPVLLAGLAGTTVLVLLYLVSRVTYLEFASGAHNDRALDPDPLGYAVLVCELATLAALPALMPARLRTWSLNAVLALGATAWLLWLTGVLG